MFENENELPSHDSFEDIDTDIPSDDDFNLDDDEFSSIEDDSSAQEETEIEEEPEQDLHKLVYNGEEKHIPYDELVKLGQMGMNYEKIYGQLNDLRNDPRLSFVDELAKENGYEDVNDFVSEFRLMQEQARLDELVQNNIPEEYAREMLESQKFRAQMQEQQQQQEQQQREMSEYQDFFDAYRQANGKDFNPETDKIPQEVLDIREQKQIPLRYAFMEFQTKQMAQQLSVYKQNQSNTKKATISGGITKHGGGDTPIDDFLAGFDSNNDW